MVDSCGFDWTRLMFHPRSGEVLTDNHDVKRRGRDARRIPADTRSPDPAAPSVSSLLVLVLVLLLLSNRFLFFFSGETKVQEVFVCLSAAELIHPNSCGPLFPQH